MSSPLATSLASWLDTNLLEFLHTIRGEFVEDDQEWIMPVVDNFCLVVAVRDLMDNQGGVFTVSRENTPPYIINGLLDEAHQ